LRKRYTKCRRREDHEQAHGNKRGNSAAENRDSTEKRRHDDAKCEAGDYFIGCGGGSGERREAPHIRQFAYRAFVSRNEILQQPMREGTCEAGELMLTKAGK
jgi:hypothetical protein